MNPARLNELVGNIEAFPILRAWDFFNHAGVSPLPRVVAEAFRVYARQAEDAAYIGAGWYRNLEALRLLAANFINAHRDEMAFVKNTSEGLATVAAGLDWKPGDRIVTTAVEYPANVYPWMNVAGRHGVELVMVPEQPSPTGNRVPLERILDEASHPNTRLVTLSHVEFASGQRHDIAAVGALCRREGKLFCVDAIQSVGALPVDVRAMSIDFLSADGHKWMLGPEGAGIFYCRRELLPRLRPLVMGWLNVINAEEFGTYDFTLKPNAGRFESGSHNIPGLLGLHASLSLLANVGIAAISERIRMLTQRLIDGLRVKGYLIVSPREHSEWSGIVSFLSSKHNHQRLVKVLQKEHKTEIALREGRLRFSGHFYNTEEQIDRLIEHLPGH